MSLPGRVKSRDKSFETGECWGTEVEYAQGRVGALMREAGMQTVPDFVGHDGFGFYRKGAMKPREGFEQSRSLTWFWFYNQSGCSGE